MTQRISAAEYQTLLFEQQTEEEFVTWITQLAEAKGWHRIHHRPAQTAAGRWITAMQGDPGFVDLVLARSGSALHLWEAKGEDGALRPRTTRMAGGDGRSEAPLIVGRDLMALRPRLHRGSVRPSMQDDHRGAVVTEIERLCRRPIVRGGQRRDGLRDSTCLTDAWYCR